MTMRDGGPSLQTDRSGQSSTIAIVLILAITLLGTGLVVGYGMQAIGDTERVTTLSKAEHAMTQFDSQAAIVALGESAVQRVDLGSSAGGQFSAEDQAGWIKIVHRNVSGTGENEVLYNASLGVVRYENEGTTVAYQGGGVWRSSDNGSAMLSPPEFNYRGATLTLPVIRIANDDSAAGETTALIKRAADSRRIYPNRSATYENSSRVYNNPITSGSVAVTVKSEFFEGWSTFLHTRTAGTVTTDPANETVTVELETFTNIGQFAFSNALDDDGLSARGQAAGHSLTNFSLTITSDKGNAFNNHYISFYGEENGHRFEYMIHVPDGVNCNSGVDGKELHVKTFYRDTDTGEQHEWSNMSSPAGSGPIRLECPDDGGSELHIDVTSSQPLTYGDTSSDGTYYDWSGSPVSDAYFGHAEDGEPTTFEPTNTTTSRHLSRHYVALWGEEFTLYARSGTGGPGQGGGAQIDFSSSGGKMEYDTGGQTYITFLHVTENDIEVELE